MPPTLLDELKRDQRWCQGNLQNFKLFFTSGLHPAHRAVFMTGVMAYLSAPLWFLFLALSTAFLFVFMKTEPTYFTEPYQPLPISEAPTSELHSLMRTSYAVFCLTIKNNQTT